MFLHVEKLEYLEAYKLRLTFSDRVTQDIDLAEELFSIQEKKPRQNRKTTQ